MEIDIRFLLITFVFLAGTVLMLAFTINKVNEIEAKEQLDKQCIQYLDFKHNQGYFNAELEYKCIAKKETEQQQFVHMIIPVFS
jgi:hypothetical protein